MDESEDTVFGAETQIARGFYSEDLVQTNYLPIERIERESCETEIEVKEHLRQIAGDSPILRKIMIAPLSRSLGAAQRWIQYRGRISITFPVETFKPKVQLAHETRPNLLPRKVAIERKRREFAQKNIGEILAAANIDSWLLIPVHVLRKSATYADRKDIPILPLEWFDDFDYNTYEPEEWLELRMLDGVKYPLPAKAFLPQYADDSKLHLSMDEKWKLPYAWSMVAAHEFDPIKMRWIVVDIETNRHYKVPRINLVFLATNPDIFVNRIRAALALRENAEKHLRFNVILDCMILTGVPIPSRRMLETIFKFVTKGANENQPNILLSIERLEEDVKLDYQRTMGKLELLHNIRTQQHTYSFISMPIFEEKFEQKIFEMDVRHTDIKYLIKIIRFATLYCLPEVIRSIDKVVIECAKVSRMNLFTANVGKAISLEAFCATQEQNSSQILQYLKGTWRESLAALISMCLRSITKGWFDLNVSNWPIYELSKMQRFMNLVKFQMQNAIRNLIENSVRLFRKHLCRACECLLHVTEDFIWGPNLLISPFNEKHPHVFYLTLQIDTEKPYYSTDPVLFVPNLTKIFDDAIRQSHFVHLIDLITIKRLVFADNLYLSSIGLLDPIVADVRDFVILSYTKALIPLQSYAKQYEKHVQLFNLDVKGYMANFKELKKNSKEIEEEIVYHFRMKENLQLTLPDNIIIGPFMVNVFPLKSYLVNKRQEMATLVIEYLTEKLLIETLVLVNAYNDIIKRLSEKPQSIEHIFETRDWMETVPELIAEHEGDMKLKLFEYEILDNFFHPLPNENFNVKWKALAGPLKCLKQIDITKEIFEEESERFFKQQISDLVMYDEKVEALNMSVSQFATQYDASKATEVSIEIKKVWRTIVETQEFGKLLNKRQLLFDLAEIDLTPVDQLLDGFIPYKTMWITAADFIKWEEAWIGNPLTNIVIENIKNTVNGYKQELVNCINIFNELPKNQEVAQHFLEKILDFEPKLMVMDWILNPAWIPYHWQKLCKITAIELKFSVTMNFSYCIAKGIMEFAEIVKEISEEATRNKDELEARLNAEEQRKRAEEEELIARKNRRRGRKIN